MKFHDLRDDRQTDSESWLVTGRPLRLTIQLEDVRREVGADAGPRIDDRQSRVVALALHSDVDLASRWRELDRVAQKVPHDLQQPHAIADQRCWIEHEVQTDLNTAPAGIEGGNLERRRDDSRQIDLSHLDIQLLLPNAGDVEQILGEHFQQPRVLLDVNESFGVHVRIHLGQVDPSDDRGQRGAQLVSHRPEEGVLVSVSALRFAKQRRHRDVVGDAVHPDHATRGAALHVSPDGQDDHRSIRPDGAVLQLERRKAFPRCPNGAIDSLAIIRMNPTHIAFIGSPKRLRRGAEDPVKLLRPQNLIAGHLPFPASETGDQLRLLEVPGLVVSLLDRRAERLLALLEPFHVGLALPRSRDHFPGCAASVNHDRRCEQKKSDSNDLLLLTDARELTLLVPERNGLFRAQRIRHSLKRVKDPSVRLVHLGHCMRRRGEICARKCLDRSVGITLDDRGSGDRHVQFLEHPGIPGRRQLLSEGLRFRPEFGPGIGNTFSLPRHISAQEDVVSRSVQLRLDVLQAVHSAELLCILAIQNHARLVP